MEAMATRSAPSPASGTESTLGRLGIEVRCDEMYGRAAPHKEGLLVVPDPFLGGEPARPGTVVEVSWRVGRERHGGHAPVLWKERRGLVLGPLKHVHLLEIVRELPWKLLFVDQRGDDSAGGVHRVRYADPDWLRVLVGPGVPLPPRQVWRGRVRGAGALEPIEARVHGGTRLGTDGQQVAFLRWRPSRPKDDFLERTRRWREGEVL